MSPLKQFITEIHRRSLWQVLLIYIGGAWACYELIDTITGRFSLPEWLPALAVILFLLGLPFVVATAFVHEVAPRVVESSEAELHIVEVEAAAARHEARRRHRFLTWRNAAASFVVALALWGLVAIGWLIVYGGAPAAQPSEEPPSVAALPFENRSEVKEDEYFTDGIHEQILTQLSKIRALSVRGRTSVMQYRDSPKNLREIGDELNARYILEGGILRAGDTVRINVQLIDALSDEHIWAQTYDRELSIQNLLAVQSEVALQVAEALGATLTAGETQQIEQKPTENFEAYDYYLRGNDYWNREFTPRIPIGMYEKAIELDPEFALALSRLAWAYALSYFLYYDRSPERLARGHEMAQEALRLEPESPEGHLALGYYFYYGRRDYERALDEFAKVRESQPNSAEPMLAMGFVQRRQGDLKTALENIRLGSEVDPRSARVARELGLTHFWLRNYAQAEEHLQHANALAPDAIGIYVQMAKLYITWRGDRERALQVLESAPRWVGAADLLERAVIDSWGLYRILYPDIGQAMDRLSAAPVEADSAFYYLVRAELLSRAGQRVQARAAYDSARVLLELEVDRFPEDPFLHGELAVAYAGLSMVEEAVSKGRMGVDLLPVSKDALDGTRPLAYLAQTYLMVGRVDAAIEQLELLQPHAAWLSATGFPSTLSGIPSATTRASKRCWSGTSSTDGPLVADCLLTPHLRTQPWPSIFGASSEVGGAS